MNKKFKIKFFLLLAMLFIFIFPFLIVSADPNLTYDPMETLPGFEETADFSVFISNLYRFGIWTVGICALIMIVIGGYMYAASGGNNASMEKAKGFITDALVGLILALLAYLILYIINPDLVKIKMAGVAAPAVTAAPPANCTGTPPSNSTICTDTNPTTSTAISLVTTCADAPCTYKCNDGYEIQGDKCVSTGAITSTSLAAAAKALRANTNVTISSSGDCKDATGTVVSPNSNLSQAETGSCSTACNSTCKSSSTPCSECVSLNKSLLDAINTVGNTAPLTVTSLAGGQHSTTSSHYSGNAADITTTNKSEWDSVVSQFKKAGCSDTFCDKRGQSVSCASADHIHVNCQ